MYKLKASTKFIDAVSVDKVATTGEKTEEMNGKFTKEKDVSYLSLPLCF